MSRRFEVDLLPATLAAALTALLAVQLVYRPVSIETVTARMVQSLPPLPATPPLPSTAEIEARPLFDPTRGAVSAADQPGDAAAAIDGVTLVGVASRGRRAVAIVRGTDAAIHSLAPGQQLFGWTLETVRSDSIVLARGDDRRTIVVGAAATKAPGQ